MTDEQDSGASASRWAEHTVVASLPRLFASARGQHTAFSEAEEPRTVVGEAPSRATAQQLLARYAALSSATPDAAAPPNPSGPPDSVPSEEEDRWVVPLRQPWFRRVAEFARDDFQRAPRIVRLLLPALPLVAAATTFLDVDPAAPALPRAVAVAATTALTATTPPAATLPTAPPRPSPDVAVTIAKHPGRTLAAEAADAAARGDRAQAIALYAQLAREHPDDTVYASAARILMTAEERDRPRSRP